MNSILRNHFENAHESLRSNRFRTFLAIIGVTIGIAGITLSLSLMTSISKSTINNTDIPDTIAVVRAGTMPQANPIHAQTPHITSTLTTDDADAITKQERIATAPMSFIQTPLVASDRTIQSDQATIIGTTGALKDIIHIEILEGQFINEASGAVISTQLSIDLFGTERSLGSVIKINDEPVTVVGIMKNLNAPLEHLHINPNATLFLPLSITKKLTHNTVQIQQIALQGESQESLTNSLPNITELITKRHHNAKDFHIITSADILARHAYIINILSIVSGVIAGISLFIGGISIMNVMLVTVAERRREIGIRKAVGATNGHIISQFLIESVIIGLLGGVIGYGIGLLGAYMLSFVLPFTLTVKWPITAAAVFISIFTGIIFGLYPASRAAAKDPIESLRY